MMGHAIRGQTAVCAAGTASASTQTNQNVKKSATKTTTPTRTGVVNLQTADIQLSVRRVSRIVAIPRHAIYPAMASGLLCCRNLLIPNRVFPQPARIASGTLDERKVSKAQLQP